MAWYILIQHGKTLTEWKENITSFCLSFLSHGIYFLCIANQIRYMRETITFSSN